MTGKSNKLISAAITPLASIFGSGFLIIVPILAGAVGQYSVFVMAGVCALAYAVGSVIRYNIKHVEPVLADNPTEATLSFERASDLAIILAYVISVCLYLHILSAFVLGGFGVKGMHAEDLLTTTIIAVIIIVGVTKGLRELGFLEKWALYITLLIILLIFLGFARYDWSAYKSSVGIILPKAVEHSPWKILTIIAGTLIVIQGFETTRYLGDVFDSDTRIKASRLSQIISTVVYIIFVALSMPLLHTLNNKYDDDSLIKMAGAASALLTVPLIIAAAFSQFSAAVADTLAASGNLEEITGKKLKEKWGYVLIGGGAIVLTWSATTFELVSLASRAFAFYYLLQCVVAFTVNKSKLQRIAIMVIAMILGFITVFAVPAN
jgi:hypothetical protein